MIANWIYWLLVALGAPMGSCSDAPSGVSPACETAPAPPPPEEAAQESPPPRWHRVRTINNGF